jgi:hypothetical protein
MIHPAVVLAVGIVAQAYPAAPAPSAPVPSGPAATTAPPVDITLCYIDRPGGVLGYRQAGVRVAFVNRSNQPLTDVRFNIAYRYDLKNVDLQGTFAPGIRIEHLFPNVVTYEYYTPALFRCDVTSVTFADGRTIRYNPPTPYPVPG